MVKRPAWGGFKPPKKPRNPSAAPPPPPAPRRYEFERALCEAIENRRLVSLRYEDDFAARTFQPEGVYHSTKDRVCVAGVQINNPAEPIESNEPRVFEVGNISALTLTDQEFRYAPRFDRTDRRYVNGVICSAR